MGCNVKSSKLLIPHASQTMPSFLLRRPCQPPVPLTLPAVLTGSQDASLSRCSSLCMGASRAEGCLMSLMPAGQSYPSLVSPLPQPPVILPFPSLPNQPPRPSQTSGPSRDVNQSARAAILPGETLCEREREDLRGSSRCQVVRGAAAGARRRGRRS